MAELKEAKRTPETEKRPATEMERPPVSWLEPWDGFGPFQYMQKAAEEMDRWFEDFGILTPRRHTGFLSRMFGRHPEAKIEGAWVPRVDMMEREGELVIHAELPGLTREQVKVEVTDDAVTLRGEHKEEKKEERKGYYYNECRHGSFFRSIPLPEGAEASKATAEFKNGVLEVMMPAPSVPRRRAAPSRSRANELRSTRSVRPSVAREA